VTLKAIEDRIGSLSKPSKMPCHGYSITAYACRRGSLLRNVKNSVCQDCYALKNRYVFPNVQAALNKRLYAVLNDPDWTELITELIGRKEKSGYFRWHDSGDIQSLSHLSSINKVALSLPHISFWLPTREDDILDEWLINNTIAPNLAIRVSASMVSQKPAYPAHYRPNKITTSSVGYAKADVHCPASKQGNQCGTCRACWDTTVKSINYIKH